MSERLCQLVEDKMTSAPGQAERGAKEVSIDPPPNFGEAGLVDCDLSNGSAGRRAASRTCGVCRVDDNHRRHTAGVPSACRGRDCARTRTVALRCAGLWRHARRHCGSDCREPRRRRGCARGADAARGWTRDEWAVAHRLPHLRGTQWTLPRLRPPRGGALPARVRGAVRAGAGLPAGDAGGAARQ
jgi:hypothetical protein